MALILVLLVYGTASLGIEYRLNHKTPKLYASNIKRIVIRVIDNLWIPLASLLEDSVTD